MTDQQAADRPAVAPGRGATPRAALLALVAAGVLAYITPPNDYDLQNTYIGGNLFPMGAMVVLLLLVLLVNPVLGRLAPRLRFQRHELGLIWCVIAITSGIPAAGLLRYWLAPAPALWYYSTPENQWVEQVTPHLKPWLMPSDPAASLAFYEGSPGGTIPWLAWRVALVNGFFLAALVFGAVACLTVVLRRQWAERERFSFPLIQLPMEVAADPEPGRAVNAFLRNPLVWCGAAIPILIHGLNGLQTYYPGLPSVDLHHNIGQYIPNVHPWRVANWSLVAHIFFSTIGFAYLLAGEIAFSMAFFRIFEILQRVFLVWTNLAVSGNALQGFASHEAYGAVLALSLMVIWLARAHLRQVWLTALGRPGGYSDDHREAFRYRVAVVGLLSCVLLLVATLCQYGIEPVMVAALVGVGLAMYIAASWGATNAGLTMVQMQFEPSDLVVSTLGSRALRPSTIVNTAMFENTFLFDLRETLMPTLMNAAQLSDETGLRQRTTFRLGALALVVAAGLATWSWLDMAYTRGGTQLAPGTFLHHSRRVWTETVARLNPGEEISLMNLVGAGFGAAMFLGLMALRLRFVGWPLHPIGLVTLYSWTNNQFGFSFLIGWAVKAGVVKAGGLRLYTRLRPFFLGVILGDVIIAAVMTVVGFVFGLGYFVTPT